MTDQDINREIADALTAQEFDKKLAWRNGNDALCAMGHAAPNNATPLMRCTMDGCGHHFIVYPHSFTDSCYLLPALEAYCAKYQLEFTCEPYNDGTRWAAVMRPVNSAALFDGDAPTLGEALRHAFHAVLTGGAE